MKTARRFLGLISRAGAAAIVAGFLSACGSGISLDPEPQGGVPPSHDASDSDADVRAPIDARSDIDAEWVDVSSKPEGATDADSGTVGTDRVDASDDAASDTDEDISIDAPDEGGTDDVAIDASVDTGADVSLDGGDNGVDVAGDTRDTPSDPLLEPGARDVADGCPPTGCEPVADYYVDAAAAPGGDGSKLRPFKTITEAIQIYAGAAGQAKTAYVRAGTYDEALGEKFPLILRGLSLEGAGQNATFIVGAGWLDHAGEGGMLTDRYMVTMVAADRALPMKIANLTLRTGSPVPLTSYFGVFCDRGNAMGDVTAAGGRTHLDMITVGPGYDTCVVASTSTIPSPTGCTLLVTRSSLTSSWKGVRALSSSVGEPLVPVAIDIGDVDPASGNVVSWMHHTQDAAAGVDLNGHVIHARFRHNKFIDSAWGVTLHPPPAPSPGAPTANYYTFQGNSFERLKRGGLTMRGGGGLVREISDNRFVDISLRTPQGEPSGVSHAVSVDLFGLGWARRNQFIGNDVGIALHFSTPIPGGPADLGSSWDPGGNVFRCNSALAGGGSGSAELGADVLLVGDTTDPPNNWGGEIRLHGNAWDHDNILVLRETIRNGADVAVLRGEKLTIDVAGGTRATQPCPAGRTAGM